MKKKINVGFFSFTGCEGCMITILELMSDNYKEWNNIFNFKYFKILKEDNDMNDLDVAFVEGAISTKKEEKMIKKYERIARQLLL